MWVYLPDIHKHCNESVVIDIMMVQPQAVVVYTCHSQHWGSEAGQLPQPGMRTEDPAIGAP